MPAVLTWRQPRSATRSSAAACGECTGEDQNGLEGAIARIWCKAACDKMHASCTSRVLLLPPMPLRRPPTPTWHLGEHEHRAVCDAARQQDVPAVGGQRADACGKGSLVL